MKVEITVKVDGKKIAKHVEQVEKVDGTLEQMEEKSTRSARPWPGKPCRPALTPSNRRPRFRPTGPSRGTKDTNNEPWSA